MNMLALSSLTQSVHHARTWKKRYRPPTWARYCVWSSLPAWWGCSHAIMQSIFLVPLQVAILIDYICVECENRKQKLDETVANIAALAIIISAISLVSTICSLLRATEHAHRFESISSKPPINAEPNILLLFFRPYTVELLDANILYSTCSSTTPWSISST